MTPFAFVSVRHLVFLGALLATSGEAIAGDDLPAPLPNAHAHNDYWHERPLFDALDAGFCSVEADVFLVEGQLLVGHDRQELRPERTLARLYLNPLRERVRANDGSVFPKGPDFSLLVDIKTDARKTQAALHGLLTEYSDILTTIREGQCEKKAVTVVISGNRDFDTLLAREVRYAGLDGRLSNLDSDLPADAMPWISDNWNLHFRWHGQGPMPEKERQKLRDIVARAHADGRRIRFWATLDSEALWRELLAAKVDLIGTDNLPKLRDFLKGHRATE